jgi:hypothetical protein
MDEQYSNLKAVVEKYSVDMNKKWSVQEVEKFLDDLILKKNDVDLLEGVNM